MQLSAYPGESFSLNVTGIDQLGLPTSVAISLSDVSEQHFLLTLSFHCTYNNIMYNSNFCGKHVCQI